jgi:hypothetical protein
MLKVVTWCAKCLFLYLLVAITALRFSWIFTLPVWQVASKLHWTQLNRVVFVLSYFLPIFAIAGFLIGLVPWGKLGAALGDLLHSFVPASAQFTTEHATIPPILWAWLPVTLAFLIRFFSWQSQTSSVFDAHRSQGRVERFFGPLTGQTSGLLDSKWISDRFIFTGPMLFLMACAVAALIRYRLVRRTEPSAASAEE